MLFPENVLSEDRKTSMPTSLFVTVLSVIVEYVVLTRRKPCPFFARSKFLAVIFMQFTRATNPASTGTVRSRLSIQ